MTTPDEWAPLWRQMRAFWPTLPVDAGEHWYRQVAHYEADVLVDALDALAQTVDRDRPTVADLLRKVAVAKGDRRDAEQRDAVRRTVDADAAAPAPAGETPEQAIERARARHARGQSIGFCQWVALGCPGGSLSRVAGLLAADGPRDAGGSAFGGFVRAAWRSSSPAERKAAGETIRRELGPDAARAVSRAIAATAPPPPAGPYLPDALAHAGDARPH